MANPQKNTMLVKKQESGSSRNQTKVTSSTEIIPKQQVKSLNTAPLALEASPRPEKKGNDNLSLVYAAKAI